MKFCSGLGAKPIESFKVFLVSTVVAITTTAAGSYVTRDCSPVIEHEILSSKKRLDF